MPSRNLAWYVYGVHGSFTVSLVDIVSSSQIQQGLHQIEQEEGGGNFGKIKKAAYLQLVSDTFPDSIDLYWKSHEILQSVSKGANPKLDKLAWQLDHRVEQKFDRQFTQSCGSCHGPRP